MGDAPRPVAPGHAIDIAADNLGFHRLVRRNRRPTQIRKPCVACLGADPLVGDEIRLQQRASWTA
jgi:hypothetical protein